MAKLGISTGTIPNDGTGDSLLAGAIKVNSNFSEIYAHFGDGTNLTGIGGTWSVTTVGIHTLKNVGIGTTNPTSRLTVNGDGRFTGILTASSFSGNSSSSSVSSYSLISGVSSYTPLSGVSSYTPLSGVSSYTPLSGVSSYAALSGVSSYTPLSGVSSYTPLSGVSSYAALSGVSSYAALSGYTAVSGVSTSVIGGIVSVTYASISGILTVGQNNIILNSSNQTITASSAGSSTTIGPSVSIISGILRATNIGIGTTLPTESIDIIGGNIRVGVNTSNGLVLTSPNGTKYLLIVANNGTLSTVAV